MKTSFNSFQFPRILQPALSAGALLGSLLAASARIGETGPAAPVPAAIGTAPLYFEANQGQAQSAFQFVARGSDCHVLLAPTEAVLVLARRRAASRDFLQQRVAADPQPYETRTISFQLAGANPQANLSGLEPLPGRANYLIGSDPAAWHIGVPLFARVQADEVYPGIRLVYYCSGRQLEYDFHLQPQARPEQISFRIAGADQLRVNAAGELVLQAGREEVRQHRPVIYQTVAGVRKSIAGGYRLTGRREVGFWLGEYDRSLPLVIDPTLEFSTYLGGTKLDIGWGVATDGAGNIYVAGETLSPSLTNSYPTTSATLQPQYGKGTRSFGDAFVAKFESSGTNFQLGYFTYLGGKSDDGALGLAVDTNGYAYLTGFTDSTNFPVTANSAFKTVVDGQKNNALHLYPVDAFVTKLGVAGTNLEYSTLLGGTWRDEGVGIAVDNAQCVYVTGLTESTNIAITSSSYPFPTVNAFQPYSKGKADAFVAKINTTSSGLNSLVYSTCLGGTNTDYGLAIAVDTSFDVGAVFVTGYTMSSNFPVLNPLQITNVMMNGTNPYVGNLLNMQVKRTTATDAFVAELDAGGALVFSSYLGGTNSDAGLGVAVDSAGSAYVTGYTYSKVFPTNVITFPRSSGTNNYSSHAFVTKITTNLLNAITNEYYFAVATNYVSTTNVVDTNVVIIVTTNITYGTNFVVTGNREAAYSTEFGSSKNGTGTGIAVDGSGNAYVAGFCTWTNFFVTGLEFDTNASYANLIATNAVAKKSKNSNRGIVAVLGPEGTNFLYGIYLGGSGNDQANAIAIDAGATNVFIAGQTDSKLFPTNNALQWQLGGVKKGKGADAFVQKIQLP